MVCFHFTNNNTMPKLSGAQQILKITEGILAAEYCQYMYSAISENHLHEKLDLGFNGFLNDLSIDDERCRKLSALDLVHTDIVALLEKLSSLKKAATLDNFLRCIHLFKTLETVLPNMAARIFHIAFHMSQHLTDEEKFMDSDSIMTSFAKHGYPQRPIILELCEDCTSGKLDQAIYLLLKMAVEIPSPSFSWVVERDNCKTLFQEMQRLYNFRRTFVSSNNFLEHNYSFLQANSNQAPDHETSSLSEEAHDDPLSDAAASSDADGDDAEWRGHTQERRLWEFKKRRMKSGGICRGGLGGGELNHLNNGDACLEDDEETEVENDGKVTRAVQSDVISDGEPKTKNGVEVKKVQNVVCQTDFVDDSTVTDWDCDVRNEHSYSSYVSPESSSDVVTFKYPLAEYIEQCKVRDANGDIPDFDQFLNHIPGAASTPFKYKLSESLSDTNSSRLQLSELTDMDQEEDMAEELCGLEVLEKNGSSLCLEDNSGDNCDVTVIAKTAEVLASVTERSAGDGATVCEPSEEERSRITRIQTEKYCPKVKRMLVVRLERLNLKNFLKADSEVSHPDDQAKAQPQTALTIDPTPEVHAVASPTSLPEESVVHDTSETLQQEAQKNAQSHSYKSLPSNEIPADSIFIAAETETKVASATALPLDSLVPSNSCNDGTDQGAAVVPSDADSDSTVCNDIWYTPGTGSVRDSPDCLVPVAATAQDTGAVLQKPCSVLDSNASQSTVESGDVLSRTETDPKVYLTRSRQTSESGKSSVHVDKHKGRVSFADTSNSVRSLRDQPSHTQKQNYNFRRRNYNLRGRKAVFATHQKKPLSSKLGDREDASFCDREDGDNHHEQTKDESAMFLAPNRDFSSTRSRTRGDGETALSETKMISSGLHSENVGETTASDMSTSESDCDTGPVAHGRKRTMSNSGSVYQVSSSEEESLERRFLVPARRCPRVADLSSADEHNEHSSSSRLSSTSSNSSMDPQKAKRRLYTGAADKILAINRRRLNEDCIVLDTEIKSGPKDQRTIREIKNP